MYLSGQGRPRPLAVPLLFFLNFGLSPQARCPLSRAESCRERAGDGRTQRPLRALEITGSLPTSTIQSVAVPIGRACANGKGRLILSPTLRRAWPPRRGPRGRHMRSRYRCSMCSAIHINSRSWLRSSSTHEPSDPPLKVITLIFSSSLPPPRGRGDMFDNKYVFARNGIDAEVCGRLRARGSLNLAAAARRSCRAREIVARAQVPTSFHEGGADARGGSTPTRASL